MAHRARGGRTARVSRFPDNERRTAPKTRAPLMETQVRSRFAARAFSLSLSLLSLPSFAVDVAWLLKTVFFSAFLKEEGKGWVSNGLPLGNP